MSRARVVIAPSPLAQRTRRTLLCASLALAYPLALHATETEAPADADKTMQTVTVTGTVDNTTENSGSLASRKASVMKGFDDVRDIPQPVTVITRQLLDDRNFLDMHDVLQNTPGVTVDYTDSERVSFHSRGYQIDAIQVDGLTMAIGGSTYIQPDTATLDRVEVLRGSAGMLRGSGNPSATVNMVRKRPAKDFQASANVTAGRWDRYRVAADVSTPLNADGSLRARAVAVVDDKHFFQKAKQERREVLYGVVDYDLSPKTTVSASLQHTDLDATGAWGGMPGNFDGSPLFLPRDTYLGADWNRWNRYNDEAYAAMEHRFDNGWSLEAKAMWTRMAMKENGFKQSYFARAANEKTNPYLYGVTTAQYTGDRNTQRAFNVTANGPFTLFGRKHELIVGAERINNETYATYGVGNLFPVANVDIRTFDPYSSYPERAVDMSTAVPAKPTYTRQKGVYGTARLSVLDPLTLLVGGRLSWWEYEAPSTPASNYRIRREATPYAGLLYDITPNLNAYISYTEIFTPQNVKDVNGNILPPVRGEDYEAGLKGDWFGGRLTASAGVFKIANEGKAVEDTTSFDPCLPWFTSGFCRIAGGKTESRGWELELAGELLPGWQMQAGYTNTRTKYVTDTVANTGNPLRTLDPRHKLNLFTNYRFGSTLAGLTVGGGVRTQSDSYATSGTGAAQLTTLHGGYSIFNAMATYRFNERYALQLNVDNLFDKVYYKKFAPTGISYYYGDPRNVTLTLRASL
ncbi:outer membrane receptor for ferric coprogen and ferric-rhodotorulic acid [Pseudoduganella lurida]|uniref:Outer membrane receptor for ferric coprogen and ferric-rhodotorulic acid n=1 Tax=Pseudoduganella lurida TaxID=1036180 RepID=A0A562QYI9_9BURK|nr:TonB-dependent siderophore receptor [Pseudoduganella lurida]TWI61898.1 outer membrane receptor for ferric coprogen and ferric-rhodotorulic acid [Pseudoduganella lurida]